MPVPSSYNDISTNSTIRDYVGWSWYQYEFYVPKRWAKDQLNVFLRFGSVHFKSTVVGNRYKNVQCTYYIILTNLFHNYYLFYPVTRGLYCAHQAHLTRKLVVILLYF